MSRMFCRPNGVSCLGGTGKGQQPGHAASIRFLPGVVLIAAWLSACGAFVKPRGEVLPVHQQAPLFTLEDQRGQEVSLRGMLDQGPVLLVFYRGHW